MGIGSNRKLYLRESRALGPKGEAGEFLRRVTKETGGRVVPPKKESAADGVLSELLAQQVTSPPRALTNGCTGLPLGFHLARVFVFDGADG